ncbi:MAG: hypothetical protein ACRDCQ_21465 [Aeromonas sobria]
MTEQAKTDTAQTQLVVIEPTSINALFIDGVGLQEMLESVRKQVTSIVPDASTPKGRKQIASLAHSCAKFKVYGEGFSKELADELKAKPKKLDANRKIFRDFMDALKDEVRAPLTQYEAAEAARVAALQERMLAFSIAKQTSAELPSAELEHYLQQIDAIAIDDSWEDMTAQAGVAKDAAVLHLRTAIEKAKAREAQAAELELLRQKQAEQERIDRERLIAEQAAAAEAQRQEQARLAAEREMQLAQEREQQAIRDAEAAELARQQAEARRIAEAEQAEQRRVQAEADARRQAEAAATRAAEQERQRIEHEQRLKAEEDARRAADRDHRGRINSAIVMDLMGLGLAENVAVSIVKSIADNKIDHLTINY